MSTATTLEARAALGDFDRAIELNPWHADAYNNRGIVYYELGEYEKALAEYDRAIAWNDPDLGIKWPLDGGSLSAKDASAPRLADIPADLLPRFGARVAS